MPTQPPLGYIQIESSECILHLSHATQPGREAWCDEKEFSLARSKVLASDDHISYHIRRLYLPMIKLPVHVTEFRSCF